MTIMPLYQLLSICTKSTERSNLSSLDYMMLHWYDIKTLLANQHFALFCGIPHLYVIRAWITCKCICDLAGSASQQCRNLVQLSWQSSGKKKASNLKHSFMRSILEPIRNHAKFMQQFPCICVHIMQTWQFLPVTSTQQVCLHDRCSLHTEAAFVRLKCTLWSCHYVKIAAPSKGSKQTHPVRHSREVFLLFKTS